MTTSETDKSVEDALSSIRRLVEPETPKPVEEGDRLLLTPEWRVDYELPLNTRAAADGASESGTLLLGANHKGEAPMLLNAVEEDVEEFSQPEHRGDSVRQLHRPAPPKAEPAMSEAPTENNEKTLEASEPVGTTQQMTKPPVAIAPSPSSRPAPQNTAPRGANFEQKIASLEKLVGRPETAEAQGDEAATTAAKQRDELAETLGEDELNEMIRTLLQKELQGELGERITKTVRKLVRREIYRALASQGLL